MSDNIASTAAEELKKWLEVLEKILNKMESDKLGAAKAKLDGERFDAMHKQLKEMNEKMKAAPDGPEKVALKQDIEAANTKLNEVGDKTCHHCGKHKNLDDTFSDPKEKSIKTEGPKVEGAKTDVAAPAPKPKMQNIKPSISSAKF